MAETFELVVLTPDKSFINTNAAEVVFATPEGSMGVMAGHMPMIAAVADGTMDVLIDGVWKTAAVSQGFVEIVGTKAEFFVDTAEWADEIDAARAREALHRAELRIKNIHNQLEFTRTQAAITRALARIKATEHSNKE